MDLSWSSERPSTASREATEYVIFSLESRLTIVCLSRLSAFFRITCGGLAISEISDIDIFPHVDKPLDELLLAMSVDELRFNALGIGGRRLFDIAELSLIQEELREEFIFLVYHIDLIWEWTGGSSAS